MSQIKLTSGRFPANGLRGMTARIVSDLANPLIIPTTVYILLGWTFQLPAADHWILAGTGFLFFTAIPLGLVLLLLSRGNIRSIDLPHRKNRSYLYRYSILSFTAGSLAFYLLQPAGSSLFPGIAAIFTVNLTAGYLVNHKFKVSVHVAGLTTAATIMLLVVATQPMSIHLMTPVLTLSVLLLLLPVMIWARHTLGVHSFKELLGGIGAGCLLTLIEYNLIFPVW